MCNIFSVKENCFQPPPADAPNTQRKRALVAKEPANRHPGINEIVVVTTDSTVSVQEIER